MDKDKITALTMRQAQDEINELRRANEILSAKVEVLDFIATLLQTKPYSGERTSKADVVWALEQQIRRLEAKES